ncbi:hypothetical protein GCM10023143_18020 [Compostibacter hankyongensis]|uniref:Uncharacterized protein n=1 Tax=Compostibacter hankyongensis TaxID=1007089 RepID=A0ABP8FS20_9BACT
MPGPDRNISLIRDPNFSKGINLRGFYAEHPETIRALHPFDSNKTGKAVWILDQWASRYNLKDAAREQLPDGSVRYANTGKTVILHRPGNGNAADLEVFGSREYTAPRKPNQPWPHLLLEQGMDTRYLLSQMEQLNFQITARLRYCNDKMDSATFKSDLHTAQFSIYLSVSNVNKQSPGYGDYLWFGLPLYDYRYRNIPRFAAEDGGKPDATKKFIYSLSGAQLYSGSFCDGKWISIDKDLLFFIKAAVNAARQHGYLQETSWEDMAISGMNIGWEMPGTFDAAMQWKDMELRAQLK